MTLYLCLPVATVAFTFAIAHVKHGTAKVIDCAHRVNVIDDCTGFNGFAVVIESGGVVLVPGRGHRFKITAPVVLEAVGPGVGQPQFVEGQGTVKPAKSVRVEAPTAFYGTGVNGGIARGQLEIGACIAKVELECGNRHAHVGPLARAELARLAAIVVVVKDLRLTDGMPEFNVGVAPEIKANNVLVIA